ncbi:Stromal cell-derived factor 2-like protein [Saguinus oedipus]|uniref:Stromal cell-derived factor 2-like protein n=1 Tax=Saguinus oedipus TaxID=9490 RepID=A0ABQ9VTL4_SAGOE|nr:Stromal cell-derived factor 2-like protein [Saguinus oedipus]
MAVVPLLLLGGLWNAVGASSLAVVTCGSVVKLLNTRHNVRLHSHDVRYGSGSGQQSVTGVTSVDDSNSYWRIRGKTATVCERGTPIKCGQPIRLTHVNTGRNLHSHHFTSPLSGNQLPTTHLLCCQLIFQSRFPYTSTFSQNWPEVSAFGEEGEGDYLDDWTVLCNGPYWVRDGEVQFKHSSTEVLLSVTGEQYGRPISGQKEVHGMAQPSQNNYWKAMEGIFMKPSELLKAEAHHAEL